MPPHSLALTTTVSSTILSPSPRVRSACDPDFASPDADVCIISADHALFKVHSQNLRAHSSIFPPLTSGSDATNDPVTLSERAEVLRIVLAYIYPVPPHPELEALSFNLLSLTYLCEMKLEVHAKTQPLQVLQYAARRGNNAMLNRLAPSTTSISLGKAAQALDGELFKQWILYREALTKESGGRGYRPPRAGDSPDSTSIKFSDMKDVAAWVKRWGSSDDMAAGRTFRWVED